MEPLCPSNNVVFYRNYKFETGSSNSSQCQTFIIHNRGPMLNVASNVDGTGQTYVFYLGRLVRVCLNHFRCKYDKHTPMYLNLAS